MKKILVLLPVEEEQRSRFAEIVESCRGEEEYELVYSTEKDVSEELAGEASVIFGNVPAALIRASEKLEYLQLMSAGADPYLKPGALSEKTVLCNATGAYGKTVSEHAFALTWMLLRKLHLYRSAQTRCSWENFGAMSTLSDATVLVVGLGDIGLRYARMVKAMGAKVIGVNRTGGPCPEGVDELIRTEEIDAALPRADVIMSVLPNTKETVHFYTAERFAAMKNSAIFINCGRGSAVAGDVLLNALRSGQIASAAVDVTETEPLPADSPLWQEENLVITPHVAGFFYLRYTYDRVIDIFCENLVRWLKHEPLRNQVDMQTGYMKKQS